MNLYILGPIKISSAISLSNVNLIWFILAKGKMWGI